MLNQIVLVGRLGNKPDIYNDGKVAKARLVTWEYWKDEATGECIQKDQWHNIASFGKAVKTLTKCEAGDMITFSGRLEYHEWEDKNATKRFKTEIAGYAKRYPKAKTTNVHQSQNNE